MGTLICNVLSGGGQLTFDPGRQRASDLYNRPLQPLGPRTRRLVEDLAIDDLTRIAQTRLGRAVLRELATAQHRTTIVMDGNDSPSLQAANVSPASPAAAEARVYFTPGVSYARADWTAPTDDLSAWELANPSHSVLLHELLHARGTVLGIGDTTTVEPADGVPADAGKVGREEHRVIGLGKYAGDPLTQTNYILERNAIARDGFGVTATDAILTARTAYRGDKDRPMSATRDPVYADLFVAITLDSKPNVPAHICAWAQTNGGMVTPEAFIAAARRATCERYAADVAHALALPREAQLEAYIAWARG